MIYFHRRFSLLCYYRKNNSITTNPNDDIDFHFSFFEVCESKISHIQYTLFVFTFVYVSFSIFVSIFRNFSILLSSNIHISGWKRKRRLLSYRSYLNENLK